MHVISTAGHVDHGKTRLIQVLTGINADRLQEEKVRGLTIDLGFAWMNLPSGRPIGIVDVPGHHRFLKNMLAGVSSVDLVLLVIAADDGWMPQTEEHVLIAEMLNVRQIVVAITKTDLVDEDWTALVLEDVRERLNQTRFQGAPIVPVSAVTQCSLGNLLKVIDCSLPPEQENRFDDPILWIDRVFSVRGAGTVVTGTLRGGRFLVDETAAIEPLGLRARIRNLQTHNEERREAEPGSRLAVNLVGTPSDQLRRGLYLCRPGCRPFYSRINAWVSVAAQTTSPLLPLAAVKLYVGSAELEAEARPIPQRPLSPGEEGFVQFILNEPTHFSFHDRFIIRDPSRDQTTGGGMFLEEGLPFRGQSLRLLGSRRREAVFPFCSKTPCIDLTRLAAKRAADGPQDYADLLVNDRVYWTESEFRQRCPVSPRNADQFGGYWVSHDRARQAAEFIERTVLDHIAKHPLDDGIPKETLRSLMGLPMALLDGIVQGTAALEEADGLLRPPGHSIALDADHMQEVERALTFTNERGAAAPPTFQELSRLGISQNLVQYLLRSGHLTTLSENTLTTPAILEQVYATARELGQKPEGFSLAEFRDKLKTSRKHGLVFLEQTDRQRLTQRQGDNRIWIGP